MRVRPGCAGQAVRGEAVRARLGVARVGVERVGVERVLCAADSAKGVRAKFRQGVARCEQRVFLNFDLTPFALPASNSISTSLMSRRGAYESAVARQGDATTTVMI